MESPIATSVNDGQASMYEPNNFKIIYIPDYVDEDCRSGDAKSCQLYMERVCELANKMGGWYQLTDAYNTELWFALLELASGLACFAFFIILYNTKELQVHPMRLIMYIAFMETIVQFALIT